LCDRLEVDNSGRTLHGALLDAELLAEVYIRLTRGQDALDMENEAARGQDNADGSQPRLDLRALALPVVPPSDTEWQAHQALLADMEKLGQRPVAWPTPG
jgi:DNA polymerase-3 subunit epsilon